MSKRIYTFDLLRGYFLLSLLLNHLQRYPSGFDFLTMRGMLFASPAEGFFIVSGIILGIVRGGKLRDAPFKVAAWLLAKRGLVLYAWAVGLAVLFTLIGWIFIDAPRLKPGIMSPEAGLGGLLAGSASLQYVYGWADFLRLYAVFMVAAPAALWLLRKNAWWAVLGGSAVLWAAFPESVFLRWQLLFFGGLTVGFHRYDIAAWWQARTHGFRAGTATAVVGMAALALSANIALVFGPKLLEEAGSGAALAQWHAMLAPYFDKESLAPGRLLLTVTLFTAAFMLFQRYEALILRRAGFLLTLGQQSLFVYILHSFIIFGLDLLVPQRQLALNFVISLLTIGIIFGAIHLKHYLPLLAKRIKRLYRPRRAAVLEEEPEPVV